MNGNTTILSLIKSLNINKLLSGANKTITFVNKAIPTYKQVRPMFGNFKSFVNIYHEIKNGKKENNISERPLHLDNNNARKFQNITNNSLTFFQ